MTHSSRRWRQLPIAMALLAPSALILGGFIVYPLVRAILQGRSRCNSSRSVCEVNGWGQYVDVAQSPEFRDAVSVTFRLAVLTVPTGVALGVGLAVLADRQLRGIRFFRAAFSSTVATSVAVTALMWQFLLEPSQGVLTNLGWLQELVPSIKSPGWLNDPDTALYAVAATSIWGNIGFTFIIVMAALQAVPDELHEAAAVDGAGPVRQFWSITFPLLAPALLFVSVVLTTRAFQTYGEVDLLTDGGPRGSTTTLAYLTYGAGSPVSSDPGLQATTAVLLFVVLLCLTALQFVAARRRFAHAR